MRMLYAAPGLLAQAKGNPMFEDMIATFGKDNIDMIQGDWSRVSGLSGNLNNSL